MMIKKRLFEINQVISKQQTENIFNSNLCFGPTLKQRF